MRAILTGPRNRFFCVRVFDRARGGPPGVVSGRCHTGRQMDNQ